MIRPYNPDLLKGFEIATRLRITELQAGVHWLVPTQSVNDEKGTRYSVRCDEGSYHCDCPRFAKTGEPCKHIWATQFVQLRRRKIEDGDQFNLESHDPLVRSRPKGPTTSRNWSAYRRGRTGERNTFPAVLMSAIEQLPPVPPSRGRRINWNDAMCAVISKTYEGKAADIFMPYHREAIEDGWINEERCANTILNYMAHPVMEQRLQALIAVFSRAIAEVETVVAIDSTGFTKSRYASYFDIKYRGHYRRGFQRAHMACGVKTNIIVAARISMEEDPQAFPPLFHQCLERVSIDQVLADSAYAVSHVFDLASKHRVRAFIEHKSNHTGRTGSPAFRESLAYYRTNSDSFYARYHMRSNIEASFMAMKERFGGSLKSRLPQSIKNEILCKVICHNITSLITAEHEHEDVTIDFRPRTLN